MTASFAAGRQCRGGRGRRTKATAAELRSGYRGLVGARQVSTELAMMCETGLHWLSWSRLARGVLTP